MPGVFCPNILITPAPPRTVSPPPRTQPQAKQGDNASTSLLQVAVKNTTLLPNLQVGPGFCLRYSMDQAEVTTWTPLFQTDDVHHFCFSYHIKGVRNSNYGGCHVHRILTSNYQGDLITWKYQFCAAQPPVSEILAPPWAPGVESVGKTTLSTKRRRPQSPCGMRNCNTKN